jgi:hypothetical protein
MIGKDDTLASAERRVVEARRMVECQRRLIDALRSTGSDTEDAERTLAAFVQSLALLESHLRSLIRSVQ